MRPKSDLRSRLRREQPFAALEDEDTIAMEVPGLRRGDDALRRHPKSGPVPRARTAPMVAPVPAEAPPLVPAEREQSGVRESIRKIEEALHKTAEDEDEKQRRLRRRTRRRGFMFGLATACVGALLGLGYGTLSERNRVAMLALNGAGELIGELERVDQQASKISDALSGALLALDAGRFPGSEARALSELEIPFDGASLAGRGIGRFKPAALSLLFDYTALVAQAKAQQARLSSLMMVTRSSVEQAFAQKIAPEFKWAVFLQNESRGPVANLQRLPQPFRMTPSEGQRQLWPTEFEMSDARGRFTLKRYLGGDPLVAGESVQLIPVAPDTQAAVCPNDSALLLRREISAMQALLAGDPTPGHEIPSLSERGRMLANELKKIGRAQNVPNK
jgi:hypothetical protein